MEVSFMANLRCGFYNTEKDPLKLLRYKFENDTKNKPVIYFRRSWFHGEKSKYVLVCPNCKEEHDIADLHYEYKQLVCKCGARYSKEDVVSDYETYCYYAERIMHNISNNTMHKVNVPTLISESYLYCPECHRTTNIDKLPIENKQRICPCGRHYSFDEIKLSATNDKVINSANVYFDDNKISVSIVAMYSSLTVGRNYYWQSGNMRFTMNLETGYSYVTHKGFYYAHHNEIYQHRNPDKKAPIMMNCSYMSEESYIGEFVEGKIEELITKYADHKNLVKIILNKRYVLRQKFTDKLFELLDNEIIVWKFEDVKYEISIDDRDGLFRVINNKNLKLEITHWHPDNYDIYDDICKIGEIGNYLSEQLHNCGINKSDIIVYVNKSDLIKIDEDLYYRLNDKTDNFIPSNDEIKISFHNLNFIVKEKSEE
jgi:hypothetical protein